MIEAILDRQIEQGRELLTDAEQVTDDESHRRWVRSTERWNAVSTEAVASCFSTSGPSAEFADAAAGHLFRNLNQTEADLFRYRQEALDGAINTLRALTERLEYMDFAGVTTTSVPIPDSENASSRRVFLVYGRNDGLRAQVENLLRSLDLEPVVLADEPHAGRTLIEKVEQESSSVAFSVVILAPEDFAVGPGGGHPPAAPNRARQNVVLELGYLMGRDGRKRVAALYVQGTELPSDVHGLGFVLFDESGAWKLLLGREILSAGVGIDLNRLA